MLISGTFNDAKIEIKKYEFEVSGVKSIHFTLLKGAFEHFFVLVKDPCQKMRALFTYKTRIKQYCLSTSVLTSDNNTISGEISDGIWSLQIIRTYPVKDGFELRIDFNLGGDIKNGVNPLQQSQDKITNPRNGWYQGDFHMHSAYSDGRVSLDEIALAAKEKHLDFIAVSDHSTVVTKFPESDVLVIPSTEITWDDNGHYNIHGLKELPDYGSFLKQNVSKSEALNSMFEYYRKRGCVISLNHPFPYGWSLQHDYNINNIDTIEVLNAPHLLDEEVDNERAEQFFDYLWMHGYYINAIGGSDAHKKNYFETYPIAIPLSRMYCEGLSIRHLLDAFRKGNCYIQVEEDFEILFHRPQNIKSLILPGNRTSGAVELKARCRTCVVWQLIKNGSLYQECTGKHFHQIINIKEHEYYRLQARSLDNNLILFVNPIHNMIKQGELTSFQDILKQFYETE